MKPAEELRSEARYRIGAPSCSVAPTAVVMRLSRSVDPIEIDFPCELPGGGRRMLVGPSLLRHFHCRYSITWWYLETFGSAPATYESALYHYARRHGVAFLINHSLLAEAYLCRASLTFLRKGGVILNPKRHLTIHT